MLIRESNDSDSNSGLEVSSEFRATRRSASGWRWAKGLGVGLLFSLLAGLVPTAAVALSSTQTVTNEDGFGAELTFDDSINPGSLTIQVALETPVGQSGDILSFFLFSGDDEIYALSADGPDVFESILEFPNPPPNACPCELAVDLGGAGLFEATGLTTTTFIVSSTSGPITLANFDGEAFRIALGRDPFGEGKDRINKRSFVKLDGLIVIPEPTTALLMLLGLSGLSAAGSRRSL